MEQYLCTKCGKAFVLSDGEKAFCARKGQPLPQQCPDCRKQLKQAPASRQKLWEGLGLTWKTLVLLAVIAAVYFFWDKLGFDGIPRVDETGTPLPAASSEQGETNISWEWLDFKNLPKYDETGTIISQPD